MSLWSDGNRIGEIITTLPYFEAWWIMMRFSHIFVLHLSFETTLFLMFVIPGIGTGFDVRMVSSSNFYMRWQEDWWTCSYFGYGSDSHDAKLLHDCSTLKMCVFCSFDPYPPQQRSWKKSSKTWAPDIGLARNEHGSTTNYLDQPAVKAVHLRCHGYLTIFDLDWSSCFLAKSSIPRSKIHM